jgi:two-component system, chemotaxis family, response regulator Rcp1
LRLIALDINLFSIWPMPAPRMIRLFVVEDDEAYLYLIKKAFSIPTEKTRWDLTFATNGQEALDRLFKEENENVPLPDLILLDWKLPRVSGDEVLRRLKQHEKLRKMPVLVFSSSEADKDIHAAYGGHANGYITKPADINLLSNIVAAIEQFWVVIAQIPKIER